MSSIRTPRQLLETSHRINTEKRIRIAKYLNEALDKLVLAPNQMRVEQLFLVKAKQSDLDVIKHLMMEAGYSTVTAIARNAGRNETDVVLSFTIPPQGV